METAPALAMDGLSGVAGPALGGFCLSSSSPADSFVARSTVMRAVLDLVSKVARSDSPVLIQGELGVGKTAVAREIHCRSRRATGPFVHVACAALRESELDKELFAACDGTPSANDRGGSSLVDARSSGTLFLDDVAQLPFWAQVRLFDLFHQNNGRSCQRAGSAPARPRVIAAATDDMETAVAKNRFYAGLYYYLSVVRISIPPLRHRQEDIRALGEHFLNAANSAACARLEDGRRRFSEEAWQTLLEYGWPGNVLQLASVVARSVTFADGTEIGVERVVESLPRGCPYANSETIPVPLVGGLKRMELAIVNEVLRRCQGNKAAAARTLGLHRRTLYRLLEESVKRVFDSEDRRP
jgi:two-component system response regulator HydG